VLESQLEVQAYLFINDVISGFNRINFNKKKIVQPLVFNKFHLAILYIQLCCCPKHQHGYDSALGLDVMILSTTAWHMSVVLLIQ